MWRIPPFDDLERKKKDLNPIRDLKIRGGVVYRPLSSFL